MDLALIKTNQMVFVWIQQLRTTYVVVDDGGAVRWIVLQWETADAALDRARRNDNVVVVGSGPNLLLGRGQRQRRRREQGIQQE
jgi:hypothetical protein